MSPAQNPVRVRPLWVVLGLVLILAVWVIAQYNSLVGLQASVQEKWAQVETQYQRRADLVPQLVSTVQGAANFEKTTLTDVTTARTQWLSTQGDPAASREEQIGAASAMDSAIARLLVSVEAYPDLKATANFSSLQTELAGTENRVAVSRGDYNTVVTTYNKGVRSFPMMVFAKVFGFEEEAFFKAAAGSEVAPEVEFNF